VFTPLAFLVLSVLTVLYGLMQGIMAVVLIGCTGLLLLMLGIAAVIMRDRLKQIGERFSDWQA
jgi:archaellum biogenesis protein FlaJ (TadC family)